MAKRNEDFSNSREARFTIGDADIVAYFISTNWQTMPTGEINPRHNHSIYEFHFVRQGVVNFKTEYDSHSFRKGTAILIPPKVFHSSDILVDYTEILNFGFEVKKNKKESPEKLYDKFIEAFSGEDCYIFENNSRLAFYSDELAAAQNEGSPLVSKINNIMSGIMFVLYDELRKEVGEAQEQEKNAVESLSSSLNFMTLENALHLSLADFAKKSFLSTKQINRICRQNYDMTYKQRQILYRVENAKRLLSESDMAIDEIAEAVGYKNLTSFYKTFSKIVGEAPAIYRKKNSKNFR